MRTQPSVIRVYDLKGRIARVDTTTASAFVSPEGMFQFGHSKDHRPDLPLLLHYEHRIKGLIYLLTIALRALVLIQFVVRRNLQKEGGTLKGIYPGQPGRQTASPTTGMMLRAFRGLMLSRIIIDGNRIII